MRSEPLASEYRGHAVYGCQPPAGSAMVASMLNILDRFDLVALGHNTAEYVATIAEAGAIPPLVALLRNGASDGQMQAARALVPDQVLESTVASDS